MIKNVESDDQRINTTTIKDIEFIEISGNIDLYTVPELKEAFDLFNNNSRNKILIDLLNVNFIDSSGLGILVTQALYLKKRNLVLKFINVNSTINHVFSLGGFTRSFKRYTNQEEAISTPWDFDL